MNPDLAARLQPLTARLPLIVSVVLVLAIAYRLADATWALLSPQPAAGEAAAETTTRRPPDVDAIAGAHLFGVADATPRAVASRVDAPDTRLDLTLRGISSSASASYARALIAGPDGKEKVYALGGEVPGGATVYAIHDDRVLLDRRGTLETLRLPKFTAAAGSDMPTPPVAEPVGAVAVDNLRNQAATDELVEVVRPQAVMVNGELRGFRVYPGRDRQRFARLGLRAGDLVTGINGAPLTDMTQSLEAMRALTGEGEITLTVQRGDETQNVTVRP